MGKYCGMRENDTGTQDGRSKRQEKTTGMRGPHSLALRGVMKD